MARCFLAHLRAYLPGIQVPAIAIIPSGGRPPPHIYSEAQIAGLMREASALKPAGSLRPHTYATLIGLLASCGLRPGEAVRLRDADVEMEATPPRLVIRETKFRKSRLVPVGSSTADALRSYASTRKRLGYDGHAKTFFVSESGTPLATAPWAPLSCALSAGWASMGRPVPLVPTFGASAILLLCGVCSTGTAKAKMSINSCRTCPYILVMQTPKTPTSI